MGAEDVVGTDAWFLYGSFWEVKLAMFRWGMCLVWSSDGFFAVRAMVG